MTDDSTAPPWNLTGNGYILLYRLSANFAAKHTRCGKYQGGFGAVMLVDYTNSNVGPYRELLFIPGVVQYPNARGYSISRIYVSTQISVDKGIENWAIPKQLADFEHQVQQGNDHFVIKAENRDDTILNIQLSAKGLQFPVRGFLLPRIFQTKNEKTYITRLKASGTGQFAQVHSLEVNSEHFPNVSAFKPLIAIKITNFHMQFPVPHII